MKYRIKPNTFALLFTGAVIGVSIASCLIGCGGAPFEAGLVELGDASPNEGSAAVDGSSGGAEGDPSVDGGGGNDALLEAASQDGSCAPMDPSLGGRPYACASDLSNHELPQLFAWDQQGLPQSCGWWPTPSECQCTGMYTCACLKSMHVCEAHGMGSFVSCNDQSAPSPEVTCAP